MKRCPACHRVENDNSLSFCRVDGTALISDSSGYDAEAQTVQLGSATSPEVRTTLLDPTTPTAARAPKPAVTRKIIKPLPLAIGIVAAFILVLAAGSYFFITKKFASINSIAVLPFENQNNDSETEYLADGLTETIINDLSRISTLHVTPRNSVYRYKGKHVDLATVSKELGVPVVLTGRLLQRNNNLVVSVELVDVHGNKQLWGEQYSRSLANLQTIEREIAAQITKALRQRLNSDDRKELTKHYTENSEAYQLYLKGQYQLNKRTEESLAKGIEYFRQATEADPNYALAYSGLADAYNQLGIWARLPPKESFPRAKAAAAKALQLDHTLAEAQAAMAVVKFNYDWDFEGAERIYQQAIYLNERHVATREWHAYHLYLADPSRFITAIEEVKEAQKMDPLSLTLNFTLSALLYFNRQYDDSIAQLAATHDLDPNFTLGYGLLGMNYFHKKMPDKAVEAWLRGSALEGEILSGDAEQSLSDAFSRSGIEGYLRKHIELLKQQSKEQYISPYFIAMDYAMLGEKELAFEWLEKAFQERSSWLVEVRVDPLWDPLRSDPRYKELLQRMGFRGV